MKTQQRLVAAALLLSMLLSPVGGGLMSASAVQTVTTDSELAYEPLAESASVAYEQHDTGYTVSLDRAADSVTMNITGVPSSRIADKARLYIRTGVALKPGTTYQVSFSLAAQREQPEFSVCFDGGNEKAAYGRLDGRSIKAGETVQVKYQITPKQESGELVLRLLLGKTEAAGNTLRFSNLAVEEGVRNETGENVVLVDQLVYNAPGAVRYWANDDSGATMTSDEKSATLAITQAPTKGAEVWKIKLLVATGLIPEAGKSYRVHMELSSAAIGEFEACFNEGDTEKGYDVLYAQRLTGGKQILERRIYVPADKQNPGELILQLSLGKLAGGSRVTVSNIRIEEAAATYIDALPKDFAYDRYKEHTSYTTDWEETDSAPLTPKIIWGADASQATVKKAGGDAEDPTINGDKVTMNITGGANLWDAQLVVDTGEELEADTIYKVSFDIESDKAYDKYEVLYGTAPSGDNQQDQASFKDGTLTEGSSIPVEHKFLARKSGNLFITYQLGKSDGSTVTVSGLKLEKIVPVQPIRDVDLTVQYPTSGDTPGPGPDEPDPPEPTPVDPGSFSLREDGNCKGTIKAGDGDVAILECTGEDGAEYQRGLWIKEFCDLDAGKSYQVSFKIAADKAIDYYRVCYNNGNDWDDGNVDTDAKKYNLGTETGSITANSVVTVNHNIVARDKALVLRIDLGKAEAGTNVTVSDISVKEITAVTLDSEEKTNNKLSYPGSFSVREEENCKGTVEAGGGNAAVLKCTDDQGSEYQRGLWIKDFCDLDAGSMYQVSFKIEADKAIDYYRVCYNNGNDWDDGNVDTDKEKSNHGTETGDITANAAAVTVKHNIIASDKPLVLRIDLGRAEGGTNVTVSDISVKKIAAVTLDSVEKADVTYPSGGEVESRSRSTRSGNKGTFEVRGGGASDTYHGTLASGTDSEGNAAAVMTCTGGIADEEWKRGLFINNICELSAGTIYQVSFDIETNGQEFKYNVCYDRNGHFGELYKEEKGFGAKYNLTASSAKSRVTYIVAPVDGELQLNLQLGKADTDTTVTVSNIKVQELETRTDMVKQLTKFTQSSTVWNDAATSGYTLDLQHNPNNVQFKVQITDQNNLPVEPDGEQKPRNWYAKLYVDTGLKFDKTKGYRAKFDIEATDDQTEFVVLWKGDIPTTVDERGTWGLSTKAGVKKTITTKMFPARYFPTDSGNLILQFELGNLNGTENTFTISNFEMEEVSLEQVKNVNNVQAVGTFTSTSQIGYSGHITRGKDFATMRIMSAPEVGGEAWKSKLFIDTGVTPKTGEGIRVIFDVETKDDADFDICFNRGNAEGGYDAIYGVHTKGGEVNTIERVFTAVGEDKLNVQLTLGKLKVSNEVTVRNIKVERISYSYSGKSALPAEISYKAPGAVSYWAHEDYTTTFTSPGDAITANIIGTPIAGAEGWKIKLFLDTGAALKPGKYYRVTANVSAKASQDYEICYNNGGAEAGYDARYGLRLIANQPQTVEQIISVPASKKDTNNLMLQFNLGKTTSPNAVTVSGVKVEEVSFTTTEMLPGNFSYAPDSGVSMWTNPDYTATLEGSANQATLHVTDVSASDPAVWKAQMKINTGAILSAGKTYLVRADLLAAKAQGYEVCYNNEEIEKGFDALYGQWIAAGRKTTVERKISVPASMTDAGELVLQFSVGGPAANDFTVSNVSVQELSFGTSDSGSSAPGTVISLSDPAGTLDVTREKLTYKTENLSSNGRNNAITVAGANLRAGERYTVAFTARADQDLNGTFALNQGNGKAAVISETFRLTPEEKTYSFTTGGQLSADGAYDLLWQFASADNQQPGGAEVEISNISVNFPPETLEIARGTQNVSVNGKAVKPDAYNINGNNYFKLRDLATLLNNTDGQFAVRHNKADNSISLAAGKAYTPLGGELTVGADYSASCVRSPQNLAIDGKTVDLKAYNIGGSNFFRLRDLNELLGFKVDYIAQSNTVAITSPLTPEAQEKAHGYDIFFLPEIDGESQAYVGDTMPFYDNGVYYIYYLKDGGDSYNHSVYVTTTKDFVHYTELDNPVLSASREDVQDSWIGTGSVVKVDQTYYFFYTGFNASGSQEYHEKIMVAKGSSPTSFEKVGGWEIVPPASLNQKNDFRDPQAYYDPATQTISLTVTAAQDGAARILKYTLGKDLKNVKYDGIIFTDPTGAFWNLECSDTFRIGDKWYLTYSGQEDTLWYAMADSRFGPYSAPTRLEGKLFYAAKHVEDGNNSYMVGWARRANSASSTQEVAGWAGNVAVQKLRQQADGSLTLVPVDSIVSAFNKQKALSASEISLAAGSGRSYKAAFTSSESFMLKGEFTYSGTGSFGLAFDFNGKEEQYKLISIDPAANKLSLSLNGGAAPITEAKAALQANQKHSFTYIQDGSVGIFYLDGQAALTVRLYGVTDKPIYLFAEDNNVTFTSLRQYTR